ncbi:MAG: DsbA family protein [Acidobacteriia bacterium]|nr:DsbA family protein [Terriglobia bacterium]
MELKALDRARGTPGLDVTKFESGLAQPRAVATIQSELAFAGGNGIHATPTLFLNGKETPLVAPEQLLTLIRQLSTNPQATESAAAPNRRPTSAAY